MKKSVTKDMTSGSPMKLLLGFMLPLTFGLLFQQFYNMVDTIVVGNFLGVNALAGVGSTGSINFLVLGFCSGVCAGFAIPVAQKFGQKDYINLRKYVANTLYLGAGFALVLTLATTLLCGDILRLMDTKADFYHEAYDYIFVIFLGIPAMILYNLLSGILRSLGNSRAPLYFLLLSSGLNIVLDLVSVGLLDMGVEGPAWATVISQGICGVLCLVYIVKKFDVLKMLPGETRPSAPHMKRLCAMGIPMGLQYSITAIGCIVIQAATNGLGTVAVASVAAGGKVSQLFCAPMDALGTTAATYAGQNVGALRLDRVRQGLKDCLIIGISYALLSFVIIRFFGTSLASMFLDENEPEIVRQVLVNAQQYQITNSAMYIPLIFIYVYRFTIQGLGFSPHAIFAGAFEMAARCLVGLFMVPVLGFTAICWANPIAWIAGDLFLVPCYHYVMHRLKRMYPGATDSGRIPSGPAVKAMQEK